MKARETEADRLRRARLLFERAVADNVVMATARGRIEGERRQRRALAIDRCGRSTDTPRAADTGPHAPPPPADDGNDGLMWWQR